MRHTKYILLAGIAALMSMGTVFAQEGPPGDRQEMTAEQRQEAKDARRARNEARRSEWENMSDEQRVAARAERDQKMEQRRVEMRQRWESMSDEDRQAVRERREERRSMHSGTGGQRKTGNASRNRGRKGG